jgi:hypothetical protein
MHAVARSSPDSLIRRARGGDMSAGTGVSADGLGNACRCFEP